MSEPATFVPTADELELLRRLDAGEPMAFPATMKMDKTERLYENGFVTIGVDGGLMLSERGTALLHAHAGVAA